MQQHKVPYLDMPGTFVNAEVSTKAITIDISKSNPLAKIPAPSNTLLYLYSSLFWILDFVVIGITFNNETFSLKINHDEAVL